MQIRDSFGYSNSKNKRKEKNRVLFFICAHFIKIDFGFG